MISQKVFLTRNTVALTRANVSLSLFLCVVAFFFLILDCANQVHTNINILFKNLNRIQLQTKIAVARRRRKVSTISAYSAHDFFLIRFRFFFFWQQDTTADD